MLFFIPDLAKPLLLSLLKKNKIPGNEKNATEDDGEEGVDGGLKRILQMEIDFKLPSKIISL